MVCLGKLLRSVSAGVHLGLFAPLAFLAPASLFAQIDTPLPGVAIWDSTTKAPALGITSDLVTLRMTPIVVQKPTDFNAVLKASGIEPEAATLRSIKSLNPGAFDGDSLRTGYAAFFPMGQFLYPKDRARYTIKFTDTDLSRTLLKADALVVTDYANRLSSLPAYKVGADPYVQGQVWLLQQMATNFELLGNSYSEKLSGSQLSMLSLQREIVQYLSELSMKADAGVWVKNYYLMQEASHFVSVAARSSAQNEPGARLGRLVTVHYVLMEQRKPLHGKRLYAIPRGMQAYPGNFNEEIIRRALALGTFDTFTSPASKMLVWGSYSVIAGPPQLTADFVKRVIANQASLDMTTVAVTTTRLDDIEFTLPVRHPPH